MKCLIYALAKEWREGGYIKARRARIKGLGWLPHFLHEDKKGVVTHMAGNTDKHWAIELFYAITGKHYAIKKGDK